jgi:hypothetical protein
MILMGNKGTDAVGKQTPEVEGAPEVFGKILKDIALDERLV